MDDVSHQSRSVPDGKAQSMCAETTESSASPSGPLECIQCGHGMNLRAYFYRRKNGAIEGRIRCTICDTLHSRVSRKHPLLIDRTPSGETQRRMFID